MGHLSLLTSNTARKVPRTYWYLLSTLSARAIGHRQATIEISVPNNLLPITYNPHELRDQVQNAAFAFGRAVLFVLIVSRLLRSTSAKDEKRHNGKVPCCRRL